MTGALETVRQVRRRAKERRRGPPGSTSLSTFPQRKGLTSEQAELRAALLDLTPVGEARLRRCLSQLCTDAHDSGREMEDLVRTLKTAWSASPVPPELSAEGWHERWSNALVVLLALYFGEAA